MSDESTPRRLTDVLPDFARELEILLVAQGEKELAAQVKDLRILERCPCNDSFCSSFYVQPRPTGAYGPRHRGMDLDAEQGMIILDAVDEKIVHVEVLNRHEIRPIIRGLFP